MSRSLFSQRHLLLGLALGVLLFIWADLAAHQATELYIPIGRSPASDTFIGEVESFRGADQTLRLVAPEGVRSLRIGDKTKIYLDRSRRKMRNLYGSTADLRQGRRAEVRTARDGTAIWIKIEVTE